MDQGTLNMTLFAITAVAAVAFGNWQIKRVKEAKRNR